MVFSVGVSTPVSSDAHTLGFHTLFDGGIDYHWSATGGPSPFGFYGDYRSGTGLAGTSASTYTFGLEVSSESLSVAKMHPYIGMGIGYGRTNGSIAIQNLGTFGESKSGLAGKIFAGTFITDRLGFELNYQMSPGIANINTNAVGARLIFRIR